MLLKQGYKSRNRTSSTSTFNVNWYSHQLVLLVTLLSLLLLPSMTKAAVSLDIDGFNPDANSFVFVASLQVDGKVLIGGFFTSTNGTVRNRIARLNANASLDTGFDPGTGDDSFCVPIKTANGNIALICL